MNSLTEGTTEDLSSYWNQESVEEHRIAHLMAKGRYKNYEQRVTRDYENLKFYRVGVKRKGVRSLQQGQITQLKSGYRVQYWGRRLDRGDQR